MEDMDKAGVLKEKLLIAGIEEIAAHGAAALSLRKVAAACGASCAAPYRHFKNKDDFLHEIILYIDEKWAHLARQIAASFADPRERICQLCLANVKFRLSNPLYECCSSSFIDAVKSALAEARLRDEEEKLFAVCTLTRGASALIEEGKLPNDETAFARLRRLVQICLAA